MKSKILLLGTIGFAALLAACGGNNNGSSATPPTSTTPPVTTTSTAMALDTAQVLALAQQTSETSTPFAVNGNALTLTDTSETSAPIGVNPP
jgi:hypothetical protein